MLREEAVLKSLEVRKETLLTFLKALLTALIIDVSASVGIAYKNGLKVFVWIFLGLLSSLAIAVAISFVVARLKDIETELLKLVEEDGGT